MNTIKKLIFCISILISFQNTVYAMNKKNNNFDMSDISDTKYSTPIYNSNNADFIENLTNIEIEKFKNLKNLIFQHLNTSQEEVPLDEQRKLNHNLELIVEKLQEKNPNNDILKHNQAVIEKLTTQYDGKLDHKVVNELYSYTAKNTHAGRRTGALRVILSNDPAKAQKSFFSLKTLEKILFGYPLEKWRAAWKDSELWSRRKGYTWDDQAQQWVPSNPSQNNNEKTIFFCSFSDQSNIKINEELLKNLEGWASSDVPEDNATLIKISNELIQKAALPENIESITIKKDSVCDNIDSKHWPDNITYDNAANKKNVTIFVDATITEPAILQNNVALSLAKIEKGEHAKIQKLAAYKALYTGLGALAGLSTFVGLKLFTNRLPQQPFKEQALYAAGFTAGGGILGFLAANFRKKYIKEQIDYDNQKRKLEITQSCAGVNESIKLEAHVEKTFKSIDPEGKELFRIEEIVLKPEPSLQYPRKRVVPAQKLINFQNELIEKHRYPSLGTVNIIKYE